MTRWEQDQFNTLQEEVVQLRAEVTKYKQMTDTAGLFIAAAAKVGYVDENQQLALITALHYLTGEDKKILEVLVETMKPKRA